MSTATEELTGRIAAKLAEDTRIDSRRFPIRVYWHAGSVVLEGTAVDIAAKRIAHGIARRLCDPAPVLDLLHVALPEHEGSDRLRDEVAHLLLGETHLLGTGLYLRRGALLEALREPSGGAEDYRIEIAIADGTVYLHGRVPRRACRRLAEVHAWWAAGCERVDNRLVVSPPEPDSDEDLAADIREVLRKDPLIRAERINVKVLDGVVGLTGTVANRDEKTLTLQDIWYVPGVRDVVDELATEV